MLCTVRPCVTVCEECVTLCVTECVTLCVLSHRQATVSSYCNRVYEVGCTRGLCHVLMCVKQGMMAYRQATVSSYCNRTDVMC